MCLSVSTIPIGLIVGIQGFNASILFLIIIFIVTFCFSLLISHLITLPIINLTKNLDSISKGKLDVKLEKSEIQEINNLTNSLNRIMASLKLAIHKVGVKKREIFEDVLNVNDTFNEKQDNIFSSILGWAWETDSNGVYTFCSANVYDYLGYLSDEIVGKNIFDFMLQDDAKKSRKTFNETLTNKEPIKNLDNWNIHKNGKKICVQTNAFAFFDESGNIQGFRGINTDITDQKIAQDKINDLNNELSCLKNEINKLSNEVIKDENNLLEPNGINLEKLNEKWIEQDFDSSFVFDIDANILDCNKNILKKLGYSKKEMLSFNMVDFDALETKKELTEKINITKKNGAYSFKTIYRKKDGSTILVFENLQYNKNKNNFKCIVREDKLPKKIQL